MYAEVREGVCDQSPPICVREVLYLATNHLANFLGFRCLHTPRLYDLDKYGFIEALMCKRWWFLFLGLIRSQVVVIDDSKWRQG